MSVEFITEQMGVHDQWYAEAKKITEAKDLVPFLERLMTAYSHDVSTVVHAMTAGALATLNVMNQYPEGHLSPVQSQKLMGLFIRYWANIEGPMKLVSWMGLLHCENRHAFTTVPNQVFAQVQEMAKHMLSSDLSRVSAEQMRHLQELASGVVPFGYSLAEEKSLTHPMEGSKP